MESLCYSANKESEDAYDVSTSHTGYETEGGGPPQVGRPKGGGPEWWPRRVGGLPQLFVVRGRGPPKVRSSENRKNKHCGRKGNKKATFWAVPAEGVWWTGSCDGGTAHNTKQANSPQLAKHALAKNWPRMSLAQNGQATEHKFWSKSIVHNLPGKWAGQKWIGPNWIGQSGS